MTVFISQNMLLPFSYFVNFFYGRIFRILPGAPLHGGFTITLSDTTLSRTLLESDQPDAKTSTWQHTTLKETDIHATDGIRTRNPSKRAAADPPIRLHGWWDPLIKTIVLYYQNKLRGLKGTKLLPACTCHDSLRITPRNNSCCHSTSNHTNS